MLSLIVFLPLLTGIAVLALPRSRPRLARWVALGGSVVTLALAIGIALRFDPADPALQLRVTLPWIPAIGASYDVAVDGLSLPLILLTTVLFAAVMVYVLRDEARAHIHAFLFLLMETGLLGVFTSQDLLLFYVFFEVSLVPMYFVIGLLGHERRRYAAMKFFLYTRAGSLAMLLAFLGLYLTTDPHTFSLPAIVAAQHGAGPGAVRGLVLLGLLLGFGVKLPTVPIHNWLPDAHVEAPTEGSVILAGLHLKLGGYGLLRVLLPAVPAAAAKYGWALAILGLVSLVYGALAALGQRDFKRLVAYTSINHMGFVMLGASIAALTPDPATRRLAITGAAYQLVSHGLLTGGMFFLAGILQDQAHTREMSRFGGLLGKMPMYATVLGLLAIGSLGLPGFSGFIAELQVIGATISLSVAAAVVAAIAVVITTGIYLRVLGQLVMGRPPEDMPPVADPGAHRIGGAAALTALAILLGVLPWPLVRAIDQAAAPPAPGAALDARASP